MKIFLILLFYVLLTITNCQAKHIYKEAEYQAYWCNSHNGVMEYQLDDKARVDCLTKRYAVEVDFASKWAECIGQALYYGISTNHKPAALLIMENEKDIRYLKRLKKVARKHRIKIYTITPQDLTAN